MLTPRIDPRTRLIVVITLSSLAVIMQALPFLIPLLLLAALTAQLVVGDLSIVRRLGRLWVVFVLLAFIQSLFTQGGYTLLELGRFPVLTTVGLERGLVLIVRLAVILLSSSLLLAENSRYIIQGLVQWRIPYELAFMVHLAIRFLPLLQEELQDAFTALQLRGIDLPKIAWRKRLYIYSYLLMPVLAGVLKRAQEISLSMEMKGFRAYPQRTSHLHLRFTPLDYAVMGASLLIFVFGVIVVGLFGRGST